MQICSACFRKRHETDQNTELDDVPKDDSVTRFYCCERMPFKGLHSKSKHGMCELLKSWGSIELAVEALEDETGITKIVNPAVPFAENVPELLLQGRTIEVRGKLDKNAKRFSINLATGLHNNSDLALHFNPRIDRHIIIRNHRIKGKWGVEEIASLQEFPFKRGRNFSILIFVAEEQFLVAINKIHYCAFVFRIPVQKIKTLIILGDVKLSLVQHAEQSIYPPVIFKKKPFIIIPHAVKSKIGKCHFKRKIKAITPGSKIEIFGQLKLLPKGFYVNLQNGISVWPHPSIPFHLSFRLHLPGTHKNEAEVIFNTWMDGFWGKEEVVESSPFLPGMKFHLQIICNPNEYKIYVNDEFFYDYQKRSEVKVDAIVIHGDVFIRKVRLH